MTHNQVIFVGTVEREIKAFTGEKPLVSLFLKGATERGSVFMPVTVRGELAQKLISKVDNLQVGDEVYIEGESTESYEKNGRRNIDGIYKIFTK